jgi:glutathionyl-hydroquinone reductase
MTRPSRTLGMPYDQAQADAQLEVLDKKLDAYEAILSAQRYLAGDVRRLVKLTNRLLTVL